MFSVLALVDYVYDFVCFQMIFFFPFPIMSINIEHSSSQNCSLGGGGWGQEFFFKILFSIELKWGGYVCSGIWRTSIRIPDMFVLSEEVPRKMRIKNSG